MKYLVSVLVLGVLCNISTAVYYADAFSPVDVVASSYLNTDWDPVHLIDGSGLIGPLHNYELGTRWRSEIGDPFPYLDFDLGELKLLTFVHIWQYHAEYPNTSPGVHDYQLQFATELNAYSDPLYASLTMSPGSSLPAASATLGPQHLDLWHVRAARYVRLSVISSFGSPDTPFPSATPCEFAGLSEIKFSETPRDNSPVPVPGAAILGLIGLAWLRLHGSYTTRRDIDGPQRIGSRRCCSKPE